MMRILVLGIVRLVQIVSLVPLVVYPLAWLFSILPGPVEWLVGLGLLGRFIDALLIFTVMPLLLTGWALGLEQLVARPDPPTDLQ